MILEPDIETMPREQMRRLQEERLRHIVAYAVERVPFYKQRLGEAGVGPDDIRTLDDLSRLPLTTKDDLRANYPSGMFAVPRSELRRIHASSGTTGKPTIVGYSAADIELFAQVNARCLAMGGAQPGMTLHNAYGYGLFTGGLGLHGGGERLGLTVVPVSGGMTERQLLLITDLRPEVICCTPSYALTLAQGFAARGIAPEDISLRYALCGAEPWTDTMRGQIDEGLGVTTTNIYGLSEIIGPGVSNECIEERHGSHINEDHFLPEIVDPDTGEALPEGEQGALVITTLTKEAMPLLRYDTRDICSLSYEPCSCGRTLVRMSQIVGRSDDMLIIRGVNVYPSEIERVIGDFPELTADYRIVLTREQTLDRAALEVEVSHAFLDRIGGEALGGRGAIAGDDAARLTDRVARRIRESVGVAVDVTLMAPGSVPRSEGGKLRRIDDRRGLSGEG